MVCLALFTSKLIAPNHPNPEKLTSYECGEEPEGNAWIQFNPKFYVIALIFLLFDVEMVFIFPWATVYANEDLIAADHRWGWFSLAEMFIFVGVLILGLAYVWRKGDLDWIKPHPIKPHVDVNIPANLYEQVNQQQSNYKVKPFVLNKATAADVQLPVTAAAPAPAKPMFKPKFKKSNEPGSDE
jgi:NADH-quinone oxidoreductase subunit A